MGDDILDSLQTETNNRIPDPVDHNYEITCQRSVTEVLSLEDNRSHDFRLTFDDPTARSASSSRKSKRRPKKVSSSLKETKEIQDLIQCILSNEGIATSASDVQNPSAKETLNTSDRSGASSRSSGRMRRWLGLGLQNEGAAASAGVGTNEMHDLIECMLSNGGIATSASDGQNPSAKEDLNISERSGASSRSSRRTRRWCPKKAAKSKQREDNMSSAHSGQTLLVDWGEFSSDDEGDDPHPIDDSERALYGKSFRQMDDSLTFVDSDEEDSIDKWIDDALMNGVCGANNNSTRDKEGVVRRRCSAVKEEGLNEIDISERS